MNIKEKIKMSFVGSLYDALIGNRKVKRILEEKKVALQTNGVLITTTVEEVLEKSGLEYFIDYGSLLGLIRDEKFIDYDCDMDYSVFINHEEDWSVLEKSLKDAGLHKIHDYIFNNQIIEQTYAFEGITIDFFKKWRADGYMYTYGCFRKKFFEYKSLDDVHVRRVQYCMVSKCKKVTIRNFKVTIPDNAEEYLATVYGRSWRIPVVDWNDDSEIVVKYYPDNELARSINY